MSSSESALQRSDLRVRGELFFALITGPVDGPLALFLHGFPDLPSTWTEVMRRFAAEGYRCVAPYMRGYPPSTTEGPFDLDRLGTDVLDFLDALSPDRPGVVLGHDWGAAATWNAVSRAKPRIAAAVTISAPHPSVLTEALVRNPAQLWRSRYMFALQARSIDRRGIERLWRRWSPDFEPPSAHLDEVADCIRRARDAPLEYYRDARRSLTRLSGVPPSSRIGVPMLYLHGRNDACIGVDVYQPQAKYMAAAYEAEVIDGAGHFVQLERPRELASRALAFFEAHGPTRPKRIGVTT